MRKNRMCGLLAAIGLMAASSNAFAETINVDCTGNPDALAAQFADGGRANTTYQIIGPCNGVTITQDNITITGSGGGQTINGGIGVTGAKNIGLQNLAIYAIYVGVGISGPATVGI